jgi:prepilin-type N-terminal cleavage/methylation domain-containing protein
MRSQLKYHHKEGKALKNTIKKGFTLIELIIVMAIFSIIMLGAMSLVDPVSTIHSRTSATEKTSAYAENIELYLKGSLQYADNLWVFQGSLPDVEYGEKVGGVQPTVLGTPSSLSYLFKEAYYHNIVNAKCKNGGIEARNYAKCKIRVMTILNKDTTVEQIDPSYAGDKTVIPKGQIVVQDVDYISNEDASTGFKMLSYPTKQLNDVYFSDAYAFDYIIGQGNFVKDGSDNVKVDTYGLADLSKVPRELNESNFAIGVLLYDDSRKDDDTPKYYTNKSSTYDMLQSDGTVLKAGIPYTYKEFQSKAKTAYYVANIPLMNIIPRETTGKINTNYYVYKRIYDSSADTITFNTSEALTYPGELFTGMGDEFKMFDKTHPVLSHTAFECDQNNISMSCDDNIVIVYALSNEVNIPQ